MPFPLTSLSLQDAPFDTIIDVRSPAEFAEDHLPGAINLPVLSDEERARVGTIYVQESPFTARKIGAALVARNAARHLEHALADKPGGWHPLVYCWRGGQRSGSFATILTQVGWRAEVLDGGYQSYRRAIVAALYDRPVTQSLTLLDGNTGTAKTELLHRLAAKGAQVLDLEGLANHRGSVLGPRQGGQPSQKMFESQLAQALAQADPDRPLVLEAESSKVGDLLVPPSLWQAMQAAPRLYLQASPEDRARYLARAYADLTADLAWLSDCLAALVPFHGHDQVAEWQTLARSGAHEALARALIDSHYDRRYAKARARNLPPVATVPLGLDEAGLEAATQALLGHLTTAAQLTPVP